MDNFTFYSPTEFVLGKGVENQAGEMAKKYGAKKVLLVYGSNSAKKSGLLDRVKDSLEKEDIEVFELGGVLPNPRTDKVYEGIEMVRDNDIDFLLPVGGGSAIDTAKAISVGVPYEGDFWDLYLKKAEAPANPMPLGAVLSIAAAGSEGSNSSVIQTPEGIKRGLHHEGYRPKFALMNPELTMTLPAYQTAAGITDMIAHILERYFTTTKNVEVTDEMAEGLLRAIMTEAPKVIKNPEDYDARANLMWAGSLAHNNIVGVGRKQDWTSHHLEHELSGLYDVTHGAGLAVIMPAWMEYMLKYDTDRFTKLAHNVFGVPLDLGNKKDVALEGIRRFRSFLRDIGMPTTFEEIGAKKEDIPILVENLGGKDHIEHSIVDLTDEDATKIYEIAAK